jgi:hypothetical protein
MRKNFPPLIASVRLPQICLLRVGERLNGDREPKGFFLRFCSGDRLDGQWLKAYPEINTDISGKQFINDSILNQKFKSAKFTL